MTAFPYTPINAGARHNADITTDNTYALPATSGWSTRVVRLVNLSAVGIHAAFGNSAVLATNTDYFLTSLGGSAATGLVAIGPNVTHISLRATTGSNNVMLVQVGYNGT
jgi:hypothetical protein